MRQVTLSFAFALGALAILLAPPVAGQAEETGEVNAATVTFFGHTHGTGRGAPMPANTQFPTGESDYSLGTTAAAVEDGATDAPENELYFYSTPGLVFVQDYNDFDYAKLHNEFGQTKDTILSPSEPIKVVFHMSADQTVGPPVTSKPPEVPKDVPWVYPFLNLDYGVQPNWRIRATLFYAIAGAYGEGASEQPVIDSLTERILIAQGTSATFHMLSLPSAIGPATLPNQIVYAVEIDLGSPQIARIPKEANFFLKLEWWNHEDGATRVAAPTWNVNGGEWFPNRFTLPVLNPIDVEAVIPQFVNERLVIHGVTNTPWGSYDVDLDSLALSVTGPRGEVEPVRIERVVARSVAHGGHYNPVNATWIWDYKGENLAPGVYTVAVTAANRQGSAVAETTATFEVREGGRPGPVTVGRGGLATAADVQEAGGEMEEAESDGGPEGEALRALPLIAAPLVLAFRRMTRR